MNHLIKEIKDLLHRPRLLLQYLVLNFFLLSVGCAAVVYIKKQELLQAHQEQSGKILDVSGQLQGLNLPKPIKNDIKELRESAKTSVEGKEENKDNSPKDSTSKN